jgi:orotidine-5'-phosphate decarboxylase
MKATRERGATPFLDLLDRSFQRTNSNAILALDLDFRSDTTTLFEDALSILDSTREFICGVKINFHLLFSLVPSQISDLNRKIAEYGMPSIADVKLNDIDNTNRVATEYLWANGFSAVIVNPFAGYAGGLDVVFRRAAELGKGVITLCYMSHKAADEGYGLILRDGRSIFELFLERASRWGADGIIMGTTRAEKIKEARRELPRSIKILSPGSGAQGGSPQESYLAGADYLIYGRSIAGSDNPRDAAKGIKESMQPLIDKRRHREEHS